jgi:hypothetical protein
MFAVVLFALVLLAILAFWAVGRGGDPQGSVATNTEDGGGMTQTANDAITANDRVDEEQGVATQGVEDPTAVTVPSQQVEAPQSGQASDQNQNPIVGDSDTAEPLDPVEGQGDNSGAAQAD